MNIVVLQGRITANPELKTTSSQKNVLSFNLAVDRYSKDGNKTDFITCVAWDKNAENISKYFLKGSKITIQGSIQTRQYERQDGSKATATEVVIDKFDFCENKNPSQQSEPNFEDVDVNGELPF